MSTNRLILTRPIAEAHHSHETKMTQCLSQSSSSLHFHTQASLLSSDHKVEVIKNPDQALREYKKAHPNIPLDEVKLDGRFLFTLDKERPVIISVDGSGTLADRFGLAVLSTFMEIFKRKGIRVTEEQIRGPMGEKKWLHIKKIADIVQDQWQKKFGRSPNKTDIDAMHDEFMILMVETLKHHAELNPGMRETLCQFSKIQNIEIAFNTGFNRAEANVLIQEAKKAIEGKTVPLRFTITSSEAAGRPDPEMLLRTLADYIQRNRILIHPWNLIAVDDTRPGIKAAINAGAWGILQVGYSSDLLINSTEQARDHDLIAKRREALLKTHAREGVAHFVIMHPCDLPLAVEEISRRLMNGEKPNDRPTTVISEGKIVLLPPKINVQGIRSRL